MKKKRPLDEWVTLERKRMEEITTRLEMEKYLDSVWEQFFRNVSAAVCSGKLLADAQFSPELVDPADLKKGDE